MTQSLERKWFLWAVQQSKITEVQAKRRELLEALGKNQETIDHIAESNQVEDSILNYPEAMDRLKNAILQLKRCKKGLQLTFDEEEFIFQLIKFHFEGSRKRLTASINRKLSHVNAGISIVSTPTRIKNQNCYALEFGEIASLRAAIQAEIEQAVEENI